jgi:hypothetical protein
MSCSWNYIYHYVLSFDYSHTHIFMHNGAEPIDSLLHSVSVYHQYGLTYYLLVLLYVALLAVTVTVTDGSGACQTTHVSTT